MQPNAQPVTTAPVSPLFASSIAAFYHNLPELLKTYYGKWIAYHGDEFLGAGRSETVLYQQCLRRGFKDDEFVVLLADNQALHDFQEIPLPPER
jgi:hypothetical protein